MDSHALECETGVNPWPNVAEDSAPPCMDRHWYCCKRGMALSMGIRCLQVLMFSATLHSDEVRNAASRICQNPILVDLKVSPLFITFPIHSTSLLGSVRSQQPILHKPSYPSSIAQYRSIYDISGNAWGVGKEVQYLDSQIKDICPGSPRFIGAYTPPLLSL